MTSIKEGVRARLALAIKEIVEVENLLILTFKGLAILRETHPLLSDDDKIAMSEKILAISGLENLSEQSKRERYFLDRQYDEDFTKVMEMYSVYVWSKMESVVRDVLVVYIVLDESISKFDKIPNINLPISFLALNDEEKRYFIISEIEQKLKVPIKQGTGRFEAMLEIFNKGGEIPRKLKNTIYELSNVRNVIVHSNSLADEKFISNCPRLGYSKGQRLRLTVEQTAGYIAAAFTYSSVILFRFLDQQTPEEFLIRWRDETSS